MNTLAQTFRNKLILDLWNVEKLNQPTIACAVGMKQSSISLIVRGKKFHCPNHYCSNCHKPIKSFTCAECKELTPLKVKLRCAKRRMERKLLAFEIRQVKKDVPIICKNIARGYKRQKRESIFSTL